jgi:hypothetical protein
MKNLSQYDDLLAEMRNEYGPQGYYVMLGYDMRYTNIRLVLWTNKKKARPIYQEHEFVPDGSESIICHKCKMYEIKTGDYKIYYMPSGKHPTTREFDHCRLPVEMAFAPRWTPE